MPSALEIARPAELTENLTRTEKVYWELFTASPPLTPIRTLDLIQISHPQWSQGQLTETEAALLLRPALNRLRQKMSSDLNIYAISWYHHWFLGPLLPPHNILTLTQLPVVSPDQQTPKEPQSLLRPFYDITIIYRNRSPEAQFRVGPTGFRILLALINAGINQPVTHENLISHVYPGQDSSYLRRVERAETLRPIISKLNKALPPGWRVVKPSRQFGYYQLASLPIV